MQIDSDEPGALHALARELIEGLGDVAKHEMQRSTDAGKWSLAALLTINGGGVLAMVGSGSRFSEPVVPATIFAFGMLLALASAAALRADIHADLMRSQIIVRHAKRVIENRLGAPSTVEELRSLWNKTWRDNLLARIPIVTEWIAAALFLIGAMSAIHSIDPDKSANDSRCEALQKDLLSARPQRSDSAGVFVALGCRPQGEGSVYAPARAAAKRDLKPAAAPGIPAALRH